MTDGKRQNLIFRVFISSTFSDFVAERNALQEMVFPRLQEFCRKQGAHFQAIDLRWGISEEAALDQQTMNICLRELDRCQQISPRPNFIILMGQRYGWCPIPAQIDAIEFESLLSTLGAEEQRRLAQWYRRDNNAIPAEYCLQPRRGRFKENTTWRLEEEEIRNILLRALAASGWAANDERRIKYVASATHQEILQGALHAREAIDHVFCFFRLIRQLPRDGAAKEFLDIDADGQPDSAARRQLGRLKKTVRHALRGNIKIYRTAWNGSEPGSDHLRQLCQDVYDRLIAVIREQIEHYKSTEPAEKETAIHQSFASTRFSRFIGRDDLLEMIHEHLKSDDPNPLVLHGVPGIGKTAVMARLSQLYPTNTIARFIGATPASNDPRSLLAGINDEISRRYDFKKPTTSDYATLVEEFHQLLQLATAAKPLYLIIDAVDQLSQDVEYGLLWLPVRLPANVKLIISTETGNVLSAIRERNPEARVYEIEPLSYQEGELLLDNWLSDAHRTLGPEQRHSLLQKFIECPRPLFLRMAFEEAKRWRSFDDIDLLSPDWAAASDLEGILITKFAQLSLPENHGSLLVARTISALTASKEGLAEDELLGILSSDPEILMDFQQRSPRSPKVAHLPVAVWSRLFTDLEPYLWRREIEESLVYSFQPGLVAKTARSFTADPNAVEMHSRLADYFKQNGDPGDNGTWSGCSHAMVQIPYHQYHARLFPQLIATLSDAEYARQICSRYGQEAMLDALEFGLAAARDASSVFFASSMLKAWGSVLAIEKSTIRALIDGLIGAGHINKAIHMIAAMPPAEAGENLLSLMLAALDRGQQTVASQLLPALLSFSSALPERALKRRLILIERMITAGHWKAIRLLCDQKSEDTALRILLFMMGAARFDAQVVQYLSECITEISDSYWRGICQLVLCCRMIRADLDGSQQLVEGLKRSLKESGPDAELTSIAARYYRWLRAGGLASSDLIPGTTDFMDKSKKRDSFSPTLSRPEAVSQKACFEFLPDQGTACLQPKTIAFERAVRRASAILTHVVRTGSKADRVDHPVQAKRNKEEAREQEAAAEADTDRFEMILDLLNGEPGDEAVTLIQAWFAKARNGAEQAELFRMLGQLPKTPAAGQLVKSAAEHIEKSVSTPSWIVLIALVECLSQHHMARQSVFWLNRLLSTVAPSMTLYLDLRTQTQTAHVYLQLSSTMPPMPDSAGTEVLRDAARQEATQLAQSHPHFNELLCREFGLRQPPLSYLADRILAFWAEDQAWSMTPENSYHYLENILRLSVVNDDRERMRSWFSWLLIITQAPTAELLKSWSRQVFMTGGPRLRYEVSLLRLLGAGHFSDSEADSTSPQAWSGVFAALGKLFNRPLYETDPQHLARWADAALRISNDAVFQARSIAFLAEASARAQQGEIAETYLALAGALDEGASALARERIQIAGIAAGKDNTERINKLRHWSSVRTFQEAWESALNFWRDAADLNGLLALTEFLRRIPDEWDHLVMALCLAIRKAPDAEAVAHILRARSRSEKT